MSILSVQLLVHSSFKPQLQVHDVSLKPQEKPGPGCTLTVEPGTGLTALERLHTPKHTWESQLGTTVAQPEDPHTGASTSQMLDQYQHFSQHTVCSPAGPSL